MDHFAITRVGPSPAEAELSSVLVDHLAHPDGRAPVGLGLVVIVPGVAVVFAVVATTAAGFDEWRPR